MYFNIMKKGTENPEIYLFEDINNENNISLNEGDFIMSLLDNFGLNKNNCRFVSIVRKESGDIENSLSEVYEDIIMCNPKIVITIGGSASEDLIGNEFSRITKDHGKLFDSNNDLGFSGYKGKIIPVYHPSYINKQDNPRLRIEFKNEIKLAIDICTGVKSINDFDNVEYEDNTIICTSYNDFDKFCKDEIDSKAIVSYDIESNAEEKTSCDYEVVGFSLASRSNMGCYVVLDSLDYNMPERDKKLICARMRKILLNKDQIITYNCMHELPATLNWLGIEIKNIEDIFVKVKLLMGNADKYEGNGGLKIQCQMNLNTKDWSEDLDKYFEYLKNYKNDKDKMIGLLSKYYSTSEIPGIIELVEKVYNDPNTFKNPKVISYGTVPYKLIGKYGGTDSSILFDLNRFYDNKIEEINKELDIDLNIGYKHWLEHHLAGYTLERNGANWNDKKASEVEIWCKEGMKESLSNLIKDDLSQDYIKEKLDGEFYIYIMNNYIDKIIDSSVAIPKRLYKSSINIEFLVNDSELETKLKMMSLEPIKRKKRDGTYNITRQYKLELGHIKTLSKKLINDHPDIFNNWYKEYMNEFFSCDRSVDEMKGLLNPTATAESFRDYVSSILITDNIHYAKFYINLVKIIEDPYFNIDEYERSNGYMKDDKKLLELIIKLQSSEDISKTNKLNIMMKFLNTDLNLQSRKIQNSLGDALAYKLESFNEYFILELFDMYEMCGLDVEDESTWTPQFRWLYNFRRYKKFSKMLSTYIYGKVGRSSVWYVDKESFENGDKLTKRQIQYYNDAENIDTSNMSTVLQTNFLVDMADTGRWKATMHTLPAGPTVKGIITSRFKGGVIFCPDCSQAEVRVLAAQSGDENLINAFMQDGMDIHKFVASLVFHNGDIDAVTSVERKIAKGAVFGILYGESEKSFADSYFKGDMKEALKVFDYFYTAFPKIKDYINESHSQFDKYKKVILPIMNRFLNMEPLALENGNDKDKIYRQCQNFIIQGQTCDLAGLILNNICKYIEDNNLKSKVFCFIHDSIEIDVHPDETFLMADMLKPLFNKYPWDTFGIPMASDIVVGASMGQESDIDVLEHDEDYNNVKISLKGFVDDIEELISIWNSVYDKVEIIEKEITDTEYVPRRGLFQQKVVINKKMGTNREKGKYKLSIIRKEELN